MEKISTKSSTAMSKAMMPTVKYNFFAMDTFLYHLKMDFFILKVLEEGGYKGLTI